MNIEERIESAVREHEILGLTVPTCILLNPKDMAEFKQIALAKVAPFLVSGTKATTSLVFRTNDGEFKIVPKDSGQIELKTDHKINGLQLLIRVMEKTESEQNI